MIMMLQRSLVNKELLCITMALTTIQLMAIVHVSANLYSDDKVGPVGQVLAGPLFFKVKTKFCFTKGK